MPLNEETKTDNNNLHIVEWFQVFLSNGIQIWLQVTILNKKVNFSGMGSPSDVEANVLDLNTVASEFELKSRSCVHFRTNTLGKDKNPLYPPSYGLNGTNTVLLQR